MSNLKDKRQDRLSTFGILYGYLLTIIQGTLLLGVGYKIFSSFTQVQREFQVRLWKSSTRTGFYMDKWDFVHWGSNFMTGLFWKVQKLPPYKQPLLMCLCLFLIATTFEVYEQYFLCFLQTHTFSCEPWEDTIKDLCTSLLGFLCFYYYPDNGFDAISLYEILVYNVAIIIFSPHYWWFEFIFYPIVVYLNHLIGKNVTGVRCLYLFSILFRIFIRMKDGTINFELFIPACSALLLVAVLQFLIVKLEQTRYYFVK